MTSSDVEWQRATGQNFLADLHNYAVEFDLSTIEFGMVTQLGKQRVSRGQPRHRPKGVGSQRPPNCCYMRAQIMRNNQILHGNQITCGENFYRATSLR